MPALFGRSGEAVVDVACGSRALTRAVRIRTTGRVVGIDVNPAMLAVARRHGGDIEFAEGDGQDLPFGVSEFDGATCQFGMMFYADPARGLTELARAGRRGAVAVWDSIERSDGYLAMQELFRDELGADAAASLDAPFAMGKRECRSPVRPSRGGGRLLPKHSGHRPVRIDRHLDHNRGSRMDPQQLSQ